MERIDFWKIPGLILLKNSKQLNGSIVGFSWYESSSGRNWVKISSNELNIGNRDNIEIVLDGKIIATFVDCYIVQFDSGIIDLICDTNLNLDLHCSY